MGEDEGGIERIDKPFFFFFYICLWKLWKAVGWKMLGWMNGDLVSKVLIIVSSGLKRNMDGDSLWRRCLFVFSALDCERYWDNGLLTLFEGTTNYKSKNALSSESSCNN